MIEIKKFHSDDYFANLKSEYKKLHNKVICLERELNMLNANSECGSVYFKKIISYVENLCLSSKHRFV